MLVDIVSTSMKFEEDDDNDDDDDDDDDQGACLKNWININLLRSTRPFIISVLMNWVQLL